MQSAGARCCVLFRFQDFFHSKRKVFKPFYGLAFILNTYIRRTYGIEFCLGCEIGSGLRIDHPNGIVIGPGVKMGKQATILQGVTLGERYLNEESDNFYPILGNNVTIGVNTSVLGKICIGNNVIIGAHSLVLKDVLDGSKVHGLIK
jgi:serine O-acetyltransferase